VNEQSREHVDHYEILELHESATQDEIKRAYRRLVRKHHPDADPLAQTAALFRGIQEAYETLRNPKTREAHDAELMEHRKDALFSLKAILSHTMLPRWQEPQMLYVLAEVEAEGAGMPSDRGLNLCLLLDRSTSMEGARLQHAVSAAASILEQLSSQDTISVVAFSDRAEVVIPPESGGTGSETLSRLRNIQTGGGTEIGEGISQALGLLTRAWHPGTTSHLLLLTDGQTYGDEARCLRLAEEAQHQQITISTFGIGTEWNEDLLDQIALTSGGLSFYVDSPERIGETFTRQVRRLSSLVCPDLRATCWLEPDMSLKGAFLVSPQVSRLSRQEESSLPLGGLSATDPTAVLLEILVAPQNAGGLRVGTLQVKGTIPADDAAPGLDARMFTSRQPIRVEVHEPPFESPPVPPRVIEAARRANLVKLEEQAQRDLERGWHENASKRLQALATEMLKMGEQNLAHTTLLEAERVSRMGKMSPEGQKRVHYGTRALRPLPLGG